MCTDTTGFFADRAESIFDIRRTPIRVEGYAVRLRQGRSHVRIGEDRFREVKGYFLEVATHRTASGLADEIAALPFEP